MDRQCQIWTMQYKNILAILFPNDSFWCEASWSELLIDGRFSLTDQDQEMNVNIQKYNYKSVNHLNNCSFTTLLPNNPSQLDKNPI